MIFPAPCTENLVSLSDCGSGMSKEVGGTSKNLEKLRFEVSGKSTCSKTEKESITELVLVSKPSKEAEQEKLDPVSSPTVDSSRKVRARSASKCRSLESSSSLDLMTGRWCGNGSKADSAFGL